MARIPAVCVAWPSCRDVTNSGRESKVSRLRGYSYEHATWRTPKSIFTEDPSYPAASPWASKLIAELTESEAFLSGAADDGRGADAFNVSDDAACFAADFDPYDGKPRAAVYLPEG